MNKKYWLRYGIGLAIVYVIFFAAFVTNLSLAEPSAEGRGLGMITLVLVNTPTSLLLKTFVNVLPVQADGMFAAGALLLLTGIIQWFVVGAFIGWLYGKIKSQKHQAAAMR